MKTPELTQIGSIGRWPVYAGFSLRPNALGRGVTVDICTHWQCSVDVRATRVSDLQKEIKSGIARAIEGLEKCAHTPDHFGLRALALAKLRRMQPAIVPHVADLKA